MNDQIIVESYEEVTYAWKL